LFVRKAALEIPSPPEVIAKTSKLTPTELRVLLAIVEVGGVPEVAAALGVADTTIKTHVSRLFAKTGATRIFFVGASTYIRRRLHPHALKERAWR
jgi:DNA-binding NarL/FixJ family response regulator